MNWNHNRAIEPEPQEPVAYPHHPMRPEQLHYAIHQHVESELVDAGLGAYTGDTEPAEIRRGVAANVLIRPRRPSGLTS